MNIKRRRVSIAGLLLAIMVTGGGLYIGLYRNSTPAIADPADDNVVVELSQERINQIGLWRTGVDANGDKLGENLEDPHWRIVCSQHKLGEGTSNPVGESNQLAYHISYGPPKWRIDYLPRCDSDTLNRSAEYQAVTVMERENGTVGAHHCDSGFNYILGDTLFCNDSNSPYTGAWNRQSSSARWISLNKFAMHSNSDKRRDPAQFSMADLHGAPYYEKMYANGNLYVFRLDNIDFGDISDVKNIEITMKGAVDNFVRIKLNGEPAAMSGIAINGNKSILYKGYVEPGWGWNSSFTGKFSEKITESIKSRQLSGKYNVLDVYIISNYSHMGLLVDNVQVKYHYNRPYDYNLVPSLSVGSKYISTGSSTVNGVSAQFYHKDSKTATRNNDKRYAVAKYVVRSGSPDLVLQQKDGVVANSNYDSDWPCEVLSKIDGSVRCEGSIGKSVHKGSLDNNQSVNMLEGYNDDVSSLGLKLGDRICYVAMVSAYQRDVTTNTFRTSEAYCVVVGKIPKVQVWGGDVRVGSKTYGDSSVYKSSIITHSPHKVSIAGSENCFGSWGEYAMFTPSAGVISSTTAGALSGDRPGCIGDKNRNKLSFANVGGYGKWGNIGYQRDVQLPRKTSDLDSAEIDVSTLDSGAYKLAKNVNISGTLKPGAKIILYSDKNVVISGNIHYSNGELKRPEDVSLLVIRARNIEIGSNVTNIDGHLLAVPQEVSDVFVGGSVSTCGGLLGSGVNYTSGLTANVCSEQLKINGSITARQLLLRRTFGANSELDFHSPAEIINFRPDAYLSMLAGDFNSGDIATDYTTELPVRY